MYFEIWIKNRSKTNTIIWKMDELFSALLPTSIFEETEIITVLVIHTLISKVNLFIMCCFVVNKVVWWFFSTALCFIWSYLSCIWYSKTFCEQCIMLVESSHQIIDAIKCIDFWSALSPLLFLRWFSYLVYNQKI